MQRSIFDQRPLTILAYTVLFIVYESLSSVYLFLPPLFALLFFIFLRALKNRDSLGIILLSFYLMIFEANQGYILFSTIIYFTLLYKIVIPKIEINFSCKSCIRLSYVLLAYLGYYLFILIISEIFLLTPPQISFYIIFYIFAEFLLVSLL